MKSNIYPGIVFKENVNRQFVSNPFVPSMDSSLKVVHPHDGKVEYFSKLVQKMLPQLSVSKEVLWICHDSSSCTTRVYFSQPSLYPASHCCGECVFIEFQYQLSGSFYCCKCNHKLANFIHTNQKDQQNQKDQNDKAIFGKKLRQQRDRKNCLKDIFVSQNFRGKSLKNSFFKNKNTKFEGEFILQLNKKSPAITPQETISENKQQQLEPNLMETKKIIQDIFK